MGLSEIRNQSKQVAALAPIFAKPFLWIAGAVVLTFSVLIAVVFGFTGSMKPLYQRNRKRE